MVNNLNISAFASGGLVFLLLMLSLALMVVVLKGAVRRSLECERNAKMALLHLILIKGFLYTGLAGVLITGGKERLLINVLGIFLAIGFFVFIFCSKPEAVFDKFRKIL